MSIDLILVQHQTLILCRAKQNPVITASTPTVWPARVVPPLPCTSSRDEPPNVVLAEGLKDILRGESKPHKLLFEGILSILQRRGSHDAATGGSLVIDGENATVSLFDLFCCQPDCKCCVDVVLVQSPSPPYCMSYFSSRGQIGLFISVSQISLAILILSGSPHCWHTGAPPSLDRPWLSPTPSSWFLRSHRCLPSLSRNNRSSLPYYRLSLLCFSCCLPKLLLWTLFYLLFLASSSYLFLSTAPPISIVPHLLIAI